MEARVTEPTFKAPTHELEVEEESTREIRAGTRSRLLGALFIVTSWVVIGLIYYNY